MKLKKLTILMLSGLMALSLAIAFLLLNEGRRDTEEIFLTDEEVEWINQNKDHIKIGYTIDYPPIEFLQNGKYAGISADYFKLLEEKLGFKIQMVQFDNFDELIKQVQSGEITGITAATKTRERSKYLDFTVPYIDNPNVIITQKNFSEKLTFEKLANTSMDILVIEGYDIIEFLDERFPKMNYRTVSSPSEGLSMVAFGQADAIIIEIMTASAIMEKNNISNIMVNIETPYESDLSIATRSDVPILNGILNKGLAQIKADERKEIEQRWVYVYQDNILLNPYFWVSILVVVILLIVIIIAISIWNSSLQMAVKEKTQALEESNSKLMYKTYNDGLTGLYNRVYLEEMVNKFSQEDAGPFSVIVADLNGLKITNDVFGHEVGDWAIIRAANIIRSSIRADHVPCRFGGDEILVMMSNTDEAEAQRIVDKMVKASFDAQEDPIKPLVALGTATMHEKFNNNSYRELFQMADNRMYANKIADNERVYNMIISSIKKQLHKNKYESMEHCQRLVKMCIGFGNDLGLRKKDIDNLVLLAEYHDIGKAGMETEVFLKEEPLSEEEWQRIKRHPELGFKIASASSKLAYIGKNILAHHERWDGGGYPQGLREEEIPFLTRIFAIVEAYDVMTHERPYKETLSAMQALTELEANSGSQFDPELTRRFVAYMGGIQ